VFFSPDSSENPFVIGNLFFLAEKERLQEAPFLA
jgi:hypothetical protein